MFRLFHASKIILFTILATVTCNSRSAPVTTYDVLPIDVPAEMGAGTSAFGINNLALAAYAAVAALRGREG